MSMQVTAEAGAAFALILPPEDPLTEVVVAQVAAACGGASLAVHDSLEQAAALHKDGQLVLILPDPTEALARILEKTGSCEAALTGWKAATAPLLAEVHRHWQRLWVLDARAVASGDPEALALFGAAGEAEAVGALPPQPEAMYMVLAGVLVAQDAETGRMAADVADLRRGGGDEVHELDLCEAALGHYAGLLQERAALRERVAVLSLQAAKADSLQRRLKEAEAQSAARDAVLAAALLTAQAEQDGRVAALQDELARVYQSRSWRITRVLRALRRS